MKKIISILLTIGMLATMLVMPVSAAETVLFTAYPQSFTLGEGTALNAAGDKVVFDEKGDSFSYTFDVDTEGIYIVAPYVSELGDTAVTPYRDMLVMHLYVDGDLMSTSMSCEATGDAKDGTYTEGRKWFDGMVKLEPGRHTIKIENAYGSYSVNLFQVFANENCVEANLPTTFTTYGEINSTATFNRSGVVPKLEGAALMRQYMGDTITGVVGVPEDGVYDFTAEIMSYYKNTTWETNEFTITLAGKTAKVNPNTFSDRYVWMDVTLIDDISLTKGVYPFTIKCTGSDNIQTAWPKLTMTKVGEITSYPTVSFYTNADNASANNGASKVYAQWTTVNRDTSIEWKFTVPQNGYYTSKLIWNEYYYDYWNPRIFIDGACYYGGYVTGTGTIVSDPLSQTEPLEETTFGTIYLTAGEHTVRVANDYAGSTRIHKLEFVGTAPVANAIEIPANVYEADTSVALETVYDGTLGPVVYFEDGAYEHYNVYASESGFYNVGVNLNKVANTMTYAVSANGTESKATILGVEGSSWRTVDLAGSVYLAAGMNDVLVRTTGVRNQTAKFVFTPVAWASKTLSAKAATLYAGAVADANVAGSVAANTEYTAVADISGAYLYKPVTLMVGVYADGKLVAAHKANGTTKLGQTITKTFTTPAEAGDYTVKVFMFDGLGTLKPYTTDATVVNPAVAVE